MSFIAEHFIEPPPFRSVDEAYEFLGNHEIATNTRFVVKTVKNFSTREALCMTTLDGKKLRYDFRLENGSKHYDGAPFAIIGVKTTGCQYGVDAKQSRKCKEEKNSTAGFKKRRIANSKKLNCPAIAKMSLIMKFPEYSIDIETATQYQKKTKLKSLRAEFSPDTQKYFLVFVKIYAYHDHGVEHILLSNRFNKEVSETLIRNATVAVLKPTATLKGKNMSGLITQFIYTNEMPICPAQPSLSQSLDQMGINEMLSFYCELTGGTPNSVFTAAGKEFNEVNLRILLHLSIVFANAEAENSTMRVAHQSVRISGTEHTFIPMTCIDASCPMVNEETHMHCPLCTKAEGYTDASALKLHFHNKHVKVGQEYGGMMFLKCRNECATKDVVKDIRMYLQGHWHCCKCSKISNKRPGFLKHLQNHIAKSGSTKIQLDKNYYVTSTPQSMCYEVKPSKSSSTIGADSQLSHISSATDEPAFKAEPDFSFGQSTEEVLQPEYDRAVLYIQGENDQIVYTTEGHQENQGEVVIQMSETDTDHLLHRLRELEHKCTELEHENMAYKSHIEFLNKKIERLTATKVNSSSPDDSDKMEIADSAAEGSTALPQQTLAFPQNNTATSQEEKTKLALQQSLKQLVHSKYNKNGDVISPDSVIMESDDVDDMNKDLLRIKTDIEQLKMALVIGSQIVQGCRQQPTFIPTVVNPVYLGNVGMPVVPQNIYQNTQHFANLATAQMSNNKNTSTSTVTKSTDSKSSPSVANTSSTVTNTSGIKIPIITNLTPGVKNPIVVKTPSGVKTASVVSAPSGIKTPSVVTEVNTLNGNKTPKVVKTLNLSKNASIVKVVNITQSGEIIETSEPVKSIKKVQPASGKSGSSKTDDNTDTTAEDSSQDFSPIEIDDAFDNFDDADIEMLDADDDEEIVTLKKVATSESVEAVSSDAGNTPVTSLPAQSPNVVVPIGISPAIGVAPAGKIVTYLHMNPSNPSAPFVLGTTSKGPTESPQTVLVGTKRPDQTVATKTVVLDSKGEGKTTISHAKVLGSKGPKKSPQAPVIVLSEQVQGQTKSPKAVCVVSEDEIKTKFSEVAQVSSQGSDKTKSPKVVHTSSKGLDKESPTKPMDTVKIINTKDDNSSSSVVLAVVNDTVNGGKKVVSLVQNSEEEATLSIPFEYKCFQKEKKTKDDGTVTEVKKECVKNQIKLKVKGNVKALQGEALQKIVDSALARFIVMKPPPAKKQKVT